MRTRTRLAAVAIACLAMLAGPVVPVEAGHRQVYNGDMAPWTWGVGCFFVESHPIYQNANIIGNVAMFQCANSGTLYTQTSSYIGVRVVAAGITREYTGCCGGNYPFAHRVDCTGYDHCYSYSAGYFDGHSQFWGTSMGGIFDQNRWWYASEVTRMIY
jgi:hypothetical protein